MIALCPWVAVQLLTSLVALLSSVVLVVWARHMRHRSHEAMLATRNAARLTSSMVLRCAPFLSCDQCGATLDPRQGVGVGLDEEGHLCLHCSEHQPA